MKKIVSLIMILIILSSSCSLAVLKDVNAEVFKDTSLPFSDLQYEVFDYRGKPKYDKQTNQQYFKYHIAVNEIIKATSIGLINGYEDGTFRPEETITRAEFIKLAIVLSTNRNFDFSAIPTTIRHWAAPYVAVAEMQKVVNVGDYNDYNLDQPITRIEMICILSKIQINMKGVSQYRDAELPNYTDIEILTEEEKELLLHAARYELVSGMFDKDENGSYTIRPTENLKRGDAAIAIMRVY